jgi:hypothetical protein
MMINQLKERVLTLSFVIQVIFYQHSLDNYHLKGRAGKVTFAQTRY